jgi:hypothetical protein
MDIQYYIAFLLNIIQLLTGIMFIQDPSLSISYISTVGMYFGGIEKSEVVVFESYYK